ncbi:MAG: response regulator [Lewinellaceae bacterium]|nr:response regulator [Lewinellaceae bacterium]
MNQKILIADDEVHIRMLLEQTLEDLEEEGIELLFADNGITALELLKTEHPRIAFLDIMMPRMNGMEVCAAVKNELALENIYIILLTAKGQEANRQKGSEAGADQYMTKPFDPDQLLRKVKEVLMIT